MVFTKEQREEQLKMCCESIIRNREKIIEGYDFNKSIRVTIEIPAKEFPVVTVENEFYAKCLID